MPSSSSVAMPAVALTRPAGGGPGLGDPEVQRVVGDLRELAVRLDHQRHARRLDRDLDLVEADLVEVGDLLLRRLDHRLRRRAAVLLVERRIERAGVHADADRQAAVACLGGDGLDVLGAADVAGIEPQAVHAGLHRRHRHLVLVMDVGDDRHRRARHDLGEPFGRLDLVARAPHDVGTGGGQRVDLLERALDVGRLGDRHRLDGDRRIAADLHVADRDLLRHLPRDERTGDLHDGPRSADRLGDVEVQAREHQHRQHGDDTHRERHQPLDVGEVALLACAAASPGSVRTPRSPRAHRRAAAAASC